MYNNDDGVFALYENWEAFQECQRIDDNTLELTGFTRMYGGNLRLNTAPNPSLYISQ